VFLIIPLCHVEVRPDVLSERARRHPAHEKADDMADKE
jgi:hypothetical protein